jgi:hypothetical protein
MNKGRHRYTSNSTDATVRTHQRALLLKVLVLLDSNSHSGCYEKNLKGLALSTQLNSGGQHFQNFKTS